MRSILTGSGQFELHPTAASLVRNPGATVAGLTVVEVLELVNVVSG